VLLFDLVSIALTSAGTQQGQVLMTITAGRLQVV
jgi:hypothetical protein